MRPFDVQVLAAIAMHQGKLAEMQTGEGKTLAAVLPAYLNALTGQGVHVLTFNDYLARRDAQWMGPLYRFLGLTVGAVQQGMSPADRRRAYACDVTYVTAKEAGFDYLRDHLCMAPEDLVHRPFHYAIVDEADSILIDEARVPLVIAGSVEARRVDPYQAAELVRSLDARRDFETDEFARNVHFTDSGLDRLESQLRCGDLHAAENLDLLTELSMALHAQVLLRREVDYIVRDGQIELVDEFTGRVAENRRWPDGLQAAVEAKEGVPLRPQGTIRGSITLQHFLRLYPKVCGMTATAQAAAAEFEEFYELAVVVIPPNRPCVRVDAEDTVFTHKEAKYAVLVAEIAAARGRGQPVLVGTASVGESEHLAARLAKAGIECRVLNARNDEQEAAIVAQAAMAGAVTISTNMAGRGTDIKLGGDPPDEREPVVARGGLYVIGTNRHESRRIDDQLRGRAGRQGDPGQSRFFISLEDDLMERYGIGDLLPQRYREPAARRAAGGPGRGPGDRPLPAVHRNPNLRNSPHSLEICLLRGRAAENSSIAGARQSCWTKSPRTCWPTGRRTAANNSAARSANRFSVRWRSRSRCFTSIRVGRSTWYAWPISARISIWWCSVQTSIRWMSFTRWSAASSGTS